MAQPQPTPSAVSCLIQLGRVQAGNKTEEAAPILAFQQGGLNEAIKQNCFLFIFLRLSELQAWRALENERSLSLPLSFKNRRAGLREGQLLDEGHTESW